LTFGPVLNAPELGPAANIEAQKGYALFARTTRQSSYCLRSGDLRQIAEAFWEECHRRRDELVELRTALRSVEFSKHGIRCLRKNRAPELVLHVVPNAPAEGIVPFAYESCPGLWHEGENPIPLRASRHGARATLDRKRSIPPVREASRQMLNTLRHETREIPLLGELEEDAQIVSGAACPESLEFPLELNAS